MGQMKTFRELQESESGQIYNTFPKTYKEWEDPEILIVGFGRMLYSQLKNKINRYPQQYAKELKRDNWSNVQYSIEHMFLDLLKAVQEIEKQMTASQWKRRGTMLKRQDK